MIRFAEVGLSYSRGHGEATDVILESINLQVSRGEFVCILGASGCGKTTLLNLAAGFLRPSRGRILFADKEVLAPDPRRGMVFQDATLFPWLTVSGNIGFALKQQGIRGRQRAQIVTRHLELMGLSECGDCYPNSLSGGMRQRVGIARVLAMESPLMLMDEPFSALDPLTRERLQDELLQLHKINGQTILYVTHSIAEAAYLADRIIILQHKSIGQDIRVDASQPKDRLVASCLRLQHQLRRVLMPDNNIPLTPKI